MPSSFFTIVLVIAFCFNEAFSLALHRGTGNGYGYGHGYNYTIHNASSAVASSTPSPANNTHTLNPRTTIWTPTPVTPWQIQLTTLPTTTEISTSPYLIYDLDLFDVTPSLVTTIHTTYRHLICYFSAGTYESWRSDASTFPPSSLGTPLADWPGEQWIDYRLPSIKAIMISRLQLAAQKGCDGVDPDNVDAYSYTSGFTPALSVEDATEYANWLSVQAHALGMSTGLKNAQDLVGEYEGSGGVGG